ncbi:Calmodulin-interacting protein 111 [Platanthera zijinensis]|uniref:Calmodulin-interacting protein 111 n=1 Tax=Platanthera zijinensis TaxID=2320716 RepID=A0AAP0BPV7_9ASPA
MTSPASENLRYTALAAAVSFLVLLRAVLSLKSLLFLLPRLWRWVEDHTHAYQSFTIPSHSDDSPENPLYRKVVAYVSALPAAEDSSHTSIFSLRPNEFSAHLLPNQVVLDTFLGARLSWTYNSGGLTSPANLVLRLRRHDRHRVLRPYLCHVESAAEEIELRRKDLRIYTNADVDAGNQRWRSAPMSHPATFDTLAIDPELKDRVRADLELFLKGRAYYTRLGRVWKRSYLLHGPPGTGKSSFVAAMARFLCYDIYDIDLSRASCSSTDLRSILLDTSPRSVILIEDFDRYLAGGCAGEGSISGVLCFMDGVFSCCAEERVMVFTTSGEEESGLDPAVRRPGRVDMQIRFPLCDFTAFKTLASSYLGVRGHKLYAQVEEGFQSGGRLSHAEVGEIMMASRGSPSRALKNVISALQRSSSSAPISQDKIECGALTVEVGKESRRDFQKLYGFIRMQSWGKKERRRFSTPV